MREVKFRALGTKGHSSTEGKWAYGTNKIEDCYGDTKKYDHLPLHMFERYLQGNYYDKKTRGEYTGLKDIDGVEIYEGDIVQIVEYEARYDGKFDEFRSEVIFINGYFGYLQYEEHLGRKVDYYLSSVCSEDGIGHRGSHFCNFVGNIYENHELLEANE